MSQLMQLQIENERTFLTYKYKKVQDIDDVILLPTLVAITVKLIPKDVWVRCQAESVNMWENGKPKKWYFAIPIVMLWLLVIWLMVKAIFW